jgi:hypothetical protein
VEHAPGRESVDDRGLGRARVDAVGHRDEVADRQHDVRGPAAGLRERRHAVAGRDPAGVGADALDDPDEVVARDERERRLVVVLAPPHLLLGEGHPRGLDPDEGLAGDGVQEVAVADPEGLGVADGGQFDLGGAHGCSSVMGLQC